jgi:hypothetical protein
MCVCVRACVRAFVLEIACLHVPSRVRFSNLSACVHGTQPRTRVCVRTDAAASASLRPRATTVSVRLSDMHCRPEIPRAGTLVLLRSWRSFPSSRPPALPHAPAPAPLHPGRRRTRGRVQAHAARTTRTRTRARTQHAHRRAHADSRLHTRVRARVHTHTHTHTHLCRLALASYTQGLNCIVAELLLGMTDPDQGVHLLHICTRTGAHSAHICTGTGLTPATSAPGPGAPHATSAPGPGAPLPHLHRDRGAPLPHLHRDRGAPRPHLRRD